MTPLQRLRSHLSYANVTASLALFIALGGTGYAAVTLPRNSVGNAQLRNNAVGPTELRPGAVRSSDIRNRTIRVGDLSRKTRSALRIPGPQGPTGPAGRDAATYRAMITQFGVIAGGNANGQAHQVGTNSYRVQFPSDVAGCTYTATLAAVQNGPTLEEPPAGRITVQSGGGANVLVKTYNAAGDPAEAPFHLIVAC
jgi:hypothetical protein